MVTMVSATLRRAPPWSLPVTLVAAAAFLVVASSVALGITQSADLATTRLFQSIASDPLDIIVNAHTIIGQLAITLPLAVIMAAVAQRRLGGYAWLGPLFILGTGAIEVVFKTLIAHPGPPPEFVRAFGNPLGVPRELHPPFAFPSGHTARLSFIALTTAWLLPSRIGATLAFGLIAFTLFARVYIGDHWISDVLGGAALGTGAAALAIGWMGATRRR